MSKQDVYPVTEMRKAILNCYELPMDTDLMEAFPILKSLPFWDYKFGIWKDKADNIRNSFIRYINYFYSPNLTCIEALHPDEIARKVACAQLAGFPVEKEGNFEKNVENLIHGKNEYCNQMILSFLKRIGSDEWSTIKYLRDRFFQNMQDSTQTIDGLETQRIVDALKKIRELKKEFLAGDTSPQLNVSMIQRQEAEDLNLSPEAISQNIENGLSPLGFSLIA